MKIPTVSPEIGKFVEDVKNAFNDRIRDNSAHAGKPAATPTAIKRAVLTVLSDGAKTGTQVIATISAASAGAWTPAESDVYPVLQDLVDGGQLNFDVVDGKKTYLITDAGRTWLAENPEAGQASEGAAGSSASAPRDWNSHNIKAKAELAKASVQLGQAVAAVASNGSVDKLQRAKAVVEDATKSVFAILGEADN